jgi:hypothetical protein
MPVELFSRISRRGAMARMLAGETSYPTARLTWDAMPRPANLYEHALTHHVVLRAALSR